MTVIQDPVKNAIWNLLNHYAYSDALFLAERLFAEVATDDALFLLATSYYRVGKTQIVEVLLEKHGLRLAECKFLYAQACYDQGKYAKAEHVLLGGSMKSRTSGGLVNGVLQEFGDSSSYVLALLGRIFQHTERLDLAETCFIKSLNLNPFLWTSFERMCEAGRHPSPDALFPCFGSVDNKPMQLANSGLNQTPQMLMQLRKKKNYMANVLTPSQITSNAEILDSSNCVQSAPVQGSQQILQTTNSCSATSTPSNADASEVTRLTSRNLTTCKEAMIDQTASDFLRSTPMEQSEWDSSVDSYTASVHPSSIERLTKTQQRISRSLMGGPVTLSPLTPSFGVMPIVETPSPSWERMKGVVTPTDMLPPPAEANPPVKKMITRQSRKVGDSSTTTGKLLFSSENSRRSQDCVSSNSDQFQPVQTIRRSTRIFANSGNSVKENAKKPTKGRLNQPKDPLKKSSKIRHPKSMTGDGMVKDLSEEINKVESPCDRLKLTNHTQLVSAQKASIDGLMRLLRDMGKALLALCQYDCRKAVQWLDDLPQHQKDTPWPLSMLARAYFEMTEYKKAADIFRDLRVNHSHHVSGLALYSTTLWHLQDSIGLSTLAHDLINMDSLSPETWCAVGNCFSLRHDNESAVKFFIRAVQLAPQYAYAHTLLGHEYAYGDDNERAMACYRKATHCDPRHYNAWYGIGSIHYKQENFALAEYHFKKALSINKRSSVLLCHLGIVQHAQKHSSIALNTLARALSLDPRNPLCKFHKSSILFAVERYDEALEELLQLKQIVPKESLVYFLLGKVYKMLGENHLAMMNFSWALDLDPKGINNHIKEAIDKQQTVDDASVFESSEMENQDDDSSAEQVTSMMQDDSIEHEVLPDTDESL